MAQDLTLTDRGEQILMEGLLAISDPSLGDTYLALHDSSLSGSPDESGDVSGEVSNLTNPGTYSRQQGSWSTPAADGSGWESHTTNNLDWGTPGSDGWDVDAISVQEEATAGSDNMLAWHDLSQIFTGSDGADWSLASPGFYVELDTTGTFSTALSNFGEELALKMLTGQTAGPGYSSIEIALYTADPGEDPDSSTDEVSDASYARQTATWTALGQESGAYKFENDGGATFNFDSGHTITHVAVHAATGSGIFYGGLTKNIVIPSGGGSYQLGQGQLKVGVH